MGQVAGGKRRGEGIQQTLGKRGIMSRSVTILGQELDDSQPPVNDNLNIPTSFAVAGNTGCCGVYRE
jgi:hypothetical protein